MESVPLPSWSVDEPVALRRQSMLAQLDAWIGSEPLTGLAALWSGAVPPDLAGAARFEWFVEFSNIWDFRAGRERNAPTSTELGDDQVALAIQAAEALGLATARPPARRRYDYTLVLGGLVRACVTRPRYARELSATGTELGRVVALGGFRELAGNELDLAAALGMDASNEFTAMIWGVQDAFEFKSPPLIDGSVPHEQAGNSDWAIASFLEPEIEVIAAPSREPAVRRANSADTFDWWARRTGNLDGSHVLLITTPIYVPYQGAAAIERLALPFDVSVETVGISADAASLGGDTQRFQPENYLQEIRSAILGHASLRHAVERWEP